MALFPPLFTPEDTSPDYQRWRSIFLGLAESFKFNYESFGSALAPLNSNDIHADHFLSQLPGFKLPQYYFNERNHVHANSFLAYGNKFTGYPMGETTAIHHFTLETYQFIWYTPLQYISNWQETFPLVFAADHNYYLECCNNYFLETDLYLREQNYPLSCPEQAAYFSPDFFREQELPGSLLLNDFRPVDVPQLPDETLKTLNFCLRLFQESTLMLGALTEIFGRSRDKSAQLSYLQSNWDYPEGSQVRSLPLYRANLLAFLYLSFHPSSTLLCYGLYRNKYGVLRSHRTAFFVKSGPEPIALKDFLKAHISTYIRHLNDQGAAANREKVQAALDLGRMFGLGYQTNQEKGTNIHRNVPLDLTPSGLKPELQGINFIVEHSENSPFWRVFYDYCGEWWSHQEMESLLAGKGKDWDRLKETPRNLAVHLFNKIAAHFWRENLEQCAFPEKLNELIRQRSRQILG